jgi:predicted dienelactone hydrolase
MSGDRARQIWLVGLTIVGAVVGFVLIIILSIVPVSSETVRAKVVAVLADRFDAEVDLRSLHVGATTRRFVPAGSYNWRGARTHALITNIWYPTESSAGVSIHSMGPTEAPWFRLGEWAENAGPAAGRFPLVVLSHGTGGSSSMMAWLAQSLASHGYIVAAVNHPGNNALEDYTAEGFLLWWERARDLTTVIDHLLKDSEFGRRIDSRRIGAAGFSLGGYTMIEIAGARTDPTLFRDFCRTHHAAICKDPEEFPGLFARWTDLENSSPDFRRATSRASASYRDRRIRAVFAIAPALGPAFTPASLRQVSIPVAIVAGGDDQIVDIASNATLVATNIPGAKLTILPAAGHYTFLASCTDRGKQMRPDLCRDSTAVDRDAIHRTTQELAITFFDQHLK